MFDILILGGLELCLGRLSPPKPPVATGMDATCSRSCDLEKITKSIERQSGLRKTSFFEKKQPTCFFKSEFLFFFKETGFCSFEKNTKTHSELFLLHHAISPFSELHNNNLHYLLWHSNLRVKKCTPSLSSQSVVGQFTPKW